MGILTYEMQYDKTLNFAMYNNDVSLIKNIKLTNSSDILLEQIEVSIQFWPDFANSWSTKVDRVPPNTTIDLGVPDLQIKPEFLYPLSERMKGQITLKVSSQEDVLGEKNYDIQILAFDEWNGNVSIPEIIAAFIIPNSPVINAILKQSAQYMEQWTKNSALNAYQDHDPNRVQQQMAAIYQSISDLAIDYVTVPASFETRGQKVRLPEDIELYKIGNCLDLTLLYTSALEAAGLNPIVIFVEGHAFSGCWLIDESFPEGAFADCSLLSKRVADGISEICLVECTALAGKTAIKFDDAVKLAKAHLSDTSKFHYFVDVKRARTSQIRPLPLRHQHKSYHDFIQSQENKLENATNISAPNKLNKIEFIESNTPAIRTRIDNWQRQLLDLSLRNSLINFRNTKSSITILCPDLYTLEDSLSSGVEFQLFPVPQELEGTVRDLEIYKKRTGNEFLSALTKLEFSQHRLRTLLSPSELNRTIVNIYRKARLVMEESGANALYLGVGLLKWYESPSSANARYAPLLLIPMEVLKKSSAFGYVIRKKDEEPMFNITLIQYIQSIFGKDMSGLEEMPHDESGVDVRTLFAVVRKYIMDMPRWEVEETAVLSVFSFNKFVMWNDLKHRQEQLQENTIVRALVQGEMNDSFANTFEDIDFDSEVIPAELLVPTSADSSQLAAIYAANKGTSFVLHGPPGTGKSQTITNMIANLLGNKKTVLFVAEKMAALTVVQKRLENLGLAPFCMELHSNKTNKKDILKKLEETLNLGFYKNSDDWELVASELYQIKQELNKYIEALHERHEIGFSLYDVLNLLSDLKEVTTHEFFTPEQAFSYTQEQYAKLGDFIRRLGVVGMGCGHPYKNAWIDIQLDTFSSTIKEKLNKAIDTNLTNFKNLVLQSSNLKSCYQIEEDMVQVSFADLRQLDTLAGLFTAAPPMEKELLSIDDFARVKEKLNSFVSRYQEFFEWKERLYLTYSDSIEEINIEALIADFNIANDKFFLMKMVGHNAVYKKLIPYLKLGNKINKKSLLAELQNIKTYMDAKKEYQNISEESYQFFGSLWEKSGMQMEMQTMIQHTETINTCIDKISNKKLQVELKKNLYEVLSKWKCQPLEPLQTLSAAMKDGESLFSLLEAEQISSKTITQLEAVLRGWRENLNGFQNYCMYNKVKKEAKELRIYEVVQAYEAGEIWNNDVVSTFHKAFYNAWSDNAILNNPYLASFSKELEEDKITKFIELDNCYMMLTRQEIFQTLVMRLPRSQSRPEALQTSNPNSEVGTLIRAIHSGGRGTALRKLFDKIPNLLNVLSPCMLMSPISVAQYLDTGFPPFDVIIFDEASQMPTYEAIGAIARGKSLIVVGDPKQLPPTTFFSNKPIEQDDEVVLQDLESILDDCLAINMPQKHLTWHYRSKHESLIAFSNYNFYEGKLITFPSCDDSICKTNFVKVDGFYDRGGTRQNKEEASAVVEEIIKLISADITKSIGVVTFNQAQQVLIEDMLEERIGKDIELEQRLTLQEHEPLFIKNLENVQGDERDIIIFSIGYGKDKNGYMSMNFGPINQDGGWRRLNVAISRARERLLVFSSISGDDINLSKTKSLGVTYLKSFLDYARLGVSALSVAPSAELVTSECSVIELEVYQKLVANGYEVSRNVGTSKFKLPLAVLSKKKGNYILGIEFDDARFKDMETARDREILINGVLKGLDWNIYRIWTQKWFSSPDEEFERLKEKIDFYEEQDEIPKEEESAKLEHSQYGADFSTIPSEDFGESTTIEYYKSTTLMPVHLSRDAFYEDTSADIIMNQIKIIISNESPVSFSILCKKVINAWGMTRAGSRIEERINFLCQTLGYPKTTFQNRVFYWDKEVDISNYSGYQVSQGDLERRNVEDIAPQEIINAAKAILMEQISLFEVDLAKEVAKVFGYVRLVESTSKKFIAALRYGVSEQKICCDQSGKYTNGDD